MLSSRNQQFLTLGVLCMFVLFPQAAWAGDGGAEFTAILKTITEWVQGGLGKAVCLSMMAYGLIFGMFRQSLNAMAVGVGGGLLLYNSPNIVNLIFTADAASIHFTEQVIIPITNGLS